MKKSQIPNKIKNYFLYVGNAYPHKNLERLIRAFNIVMSQYFDISLILVGREDYFYKHLKKKIKEMNLSDKVIFLENINDEELSNLYQNALALIIPSLTEGFGLPALEAMANKCLVMCSDIPSLREVCKDCAIYFNPYNIKDIAEKTKDVLDHSDDTYHYSDRKEKGFKRSKQFSWKKMAKETLAVYESVRGDL